MKRFLALSCIAAATLYLTKLYFRGGVCCCKTRLDGKIVIITGANSGLGFATAKEAAARGATVVLACRDAKKAEEAKRKITLSTGNKKVSHVPLDLSSFSSILGFEGAISTLCAGSEDCLYALVNNAGIFHHPPKTTEDGFDITFQTNYLGVYLLTQLLLKSLKKTEHARIVFVTSQAHFIPKSLDISSLTSPANQQNHFLHYGVSKLCLLLFALKLARNLEDSSVRVIAVDPGNVETNIFRHFPRFRNKFLFYLEKPLRLVLVKTPWEGAQTLLHSLLSSDIQSGGYYRDCKLTSPSQLALSPELADSLWHKSFLWSSSYNG